MSVDADTRKWLYLITKGRAMYDEPMSRHTSFKVGGPAEVFLEPESLGELRDVIEGLSLRDVRYLVIGSGTNIVVSDSGIPGAVICLKRNLKTISIQKINESFSRITAMSGAGLGILCSLAIKNGLKGMNFALGIPGTVGGAVIMNAGTSLGSIGNVIESVTVLYPTGRIEKIDRKNLHFSYRAMMLNKEISCITSDNIIIVSACFCLEKGSVSELRSEAGQIMKNRRLQQPVKLPSAGCIFKNPKTGKTAGQLIDLAGLKGKRIGGAEVSVKHANFIINNGNATAGDILGLIKMIRQEIYERFQVDLELEVIVL